MISGMSRPAAVVDSRQCQLQRRPPTAARAAAGAAAAAAAAGRKLWQERRYVGSREELTF